MNKILLISTGGTLASSCSVNGLAPGMGGKEILSKIEGLTAGFAVDTLPGRHVEDRSNNS